MQWMLMAGIGLIVATAGCQGGRTKSVDPADGSVALRIDDSTREETIISALPQGMPIAEALKILKDAGCECKPDESGGVYYCRHNRKSGFWVTFVWKITVRHDGNVITDVRCEHHGIGP